MDYKTIQFFDVESFPTFACVTFKEDKTGKIIQFKFGCGYNDLKYIQEFLDDHNLLVGFNNISYDNAVIRFIQNQESGRNLAQKCFKLSQRLIDDTHRKDEDIRELRYPRNSFYNWDYLDLFKIMHFDRLGVGLKQIGVNLLHEKVQDLPYPYDYQITTDEEIQNVLTYNINDVDITEKLYYRIQDQINLRKEIGQLYHVDVMNASDSKMGNIILEHYYQEEFGIDISNIRNLRTKRTSVLLGDCIPAVIQFQTSELQELHNKIKSTKVFSFDNYKFEEILTYRGTRYSIGSGGIHSMESACRFDTTTEKKIISCDIGSMYPTCIILNNIYPEHLDENFVKVLSTITAERLAAKKTNKVKADALKITINGLYGKLNSDTFWLEDAKAMLSVTIAGQLYILMLVEALELQDIHCISANTDGIECEVPIEKEALYYSACKEWETKTGFKLEFVEYKSYIKRDINNYIAITKDGKAKTKGAFIPEIDLKKGYKHPIVPKAVYEYFVHGIPVEQTIESCNDIFQFCISQKVGKDFTMQLKSLSGVKDLQKTNRFFISRYGGFLQKKHEDGRIIGLFVGKMVQLLNDYDHTKSFESYLVDTSWYIKEAKSMIEEIEPSAVQITMFDARADYGAYTNMLGQKVTKKKKTSVLDNKVTPEEIKYDSYHKKIVYDVDISLALVTETDTIYSPVVTLYFLSKGSVNKFKISKEIFKQNSLKYGDVIKINSLEKKPRYRKEGNEYIPIDGQFVYWINEYEKVEDFSNFKRKLT